MKFTKIECIAQFGFSFLAKFYDFQFADQIGRRLSWSDDGAIDLGAHVPFGIRDILQIITQPNCAKN